MHRESVNSALNVAWILPIDIYMRLSVCVHAHKYKMCMDRFVCVRSFFFCVVVFMWVNINMYACVCVVVRVRLYRRVCVCEREREILCVCVCARLYSRIYIYVRESACVCVCVCPFPNVPLTSITTHTHLLTRSHGAQTGERMHVFTKSV